jgi:type VI secretion system protein ImpL
LHEAAGRLNTLAGPSSPLLQLFYTISHNTAVSDTRIKSTFQPAQVLVDPNATDKLIGGGNAAYSGALLKLSSAIDQVATQVGQNPASATDPTAYAPINGAVTDAKLAANTTAQTFNPDDPQLKIGSSILKMMQDPVECASKIPPSPGAAVNGAGKKLCDTMNPVLAKFPFNPNSTTMATVPEVNQIFAPETGAVATLLNTTFKPFFVVQNGQFVPAPNAPQPPNPRFGQFLSRAAQSTAKLYPPGSQNPTFSFTPHLLPSKGITTAALELDGQKIPNGVSITWNGTTAHEAAVYYDSNLGGQYQGTWSIFQLAKVGQPTKSPTGVRLDFPIVTTFAGQKVDQSAPAKVVSFDITGPGAELFLPGYFGGLSCVSTVVK